MVLEGGGRVDGVVLLLLQLCVCGGGSRKCMKIHWPVSLAVVVALAADVAGVVVALHC